jgi:hypothetical protein
MTKPIDRFDVRADARGWTVYDIFTSEAAVIAMAPQTGLSRVDADHTAALLSERARRGDQTLKQ